MRCHCCYGWRWHIVWYVSKCSRFVKSFAEIVNGLYESDLQSTPVSIVAVGSANVISTCLKLSDPIEASVAIVSGRYSSMDVFETTQYDENKGQDLLSPTIRKTSFTNAGANSVGEVPVLKRIGIVMTGWGLISDCDFESEKWRWMGEIRFTLMAVQKIALWTPYPCKVHFSGLKATPGSIQMDSKGNFKIPEDWQCVENPNFVAMVNGSHISATSMIAPGASLNDGKLWLVMLVKQNRCTMAQKLLEMDSGAHAGKHGVLIVPTKELVIAPGRKGVWMDVDGERQSGSVPIYVQILPFKLRISCT
jgi:diacylglycerol kinase family enzyme